MKSYRMDGTWYTVQASCMKQALLKLVDADGEFTYKNHWYTHDDRKAWADFWLPDGYHGIVREI